MEKPDIESFKDDWGLYDDMEYTKALEAYITHLESSKLTEWELMEILEKHAYHEYAGAPGRDLIHRDSFPEIAVEIKTKLKTE